MNELRRRMASEVVRCGHCRRDIDLDELHWYDPADGDVSCVGCHRSAALSTRKTD